MFVVWSLRIEKQPWFCVLPSPLTSAPVGCLSSVDFHSWSLFGKRTKLTRVPGRTGTISVPVSRSPQQIFLYSDQMHCLKVLIWVKVGTLRCKTCLMKAIQEHKLEEFDYRRHVFRHFLKRGDWGGAGRGTPILFQRGWFSLTVRLW